MRKMKLTYCKLGNQKIAQSVIRFDLPTHVCGQRCFRCYARKSEVLFPNTLKFRNRNLDLANSDQFVETIDNEIKFSGVSICRPHCSGDFFSQKYVDDWTEVMKRNPKVRFYFWSKKLDKFDFSKMAKRRNCNAMDSITPLGLNYGNQEFIVKLRDEHGYTICPDMGEHMVCMRSCKLCLKEKKVAFLIH